ncbi:hypothetical protein RDV89_17500 [Nocardioides zeae]|uniref:Uncharacterized protein n=1 Tax=Nocardioides imazamoxiresistens TaxID=3231893 RepID=A0ABU3Q055_9ACTN|nr:hypothetical protein [Nocardioides zeae]MDT9594888.1 hypothetical protein [Nocardioides zeae]
MRDIAREDVPSLVAAIEAVEVTRAGRWRTGEVREGDVLLGMVYVGIGGVPSDLRKQLGNLLNGIPFNDRRVPRRAR